MTELRGCVGITLGLVLNSRGDLGMRMGRDHSPASLGIQSLKTKEEKPNFTELGEELGEFGFRGRILLLSPKAFQASQPLTLLKI